VETELRPRGPVGAVLIHETTRSWRLRMLLGRFTRGSPELSRLAWGVSELWQYMQASPCRSVETEFCPRVSVGVVLVRPAAKPGGRTEQRNLYLYIYIYLPIYLSIHIYLSIYLSIYIYLYIYLSVSISIDLYLSICLSICIEKKRRSPLSQCGSRTLPPCFGRGSSRAAHGQAKWSSRAAPERPEG